MSFRLNLREFHPLLSEPSLYGAHSLEGSPIVGRGIGALAQPLELLYEARGLPLMDHLLHQNLLQKIMYPCPRFALS